MSTLETLRDGLLDELKDIYSAEHQLLKALPKMEKRACNDKLKSAIGSHLHETEGQVERLEQIGRILQTKLSGKTCKAMQGLIEEGKEVLELESENESLIDALLIGAAQRVEHYEMAAYGTARAMAKQLGEDKIVALLQKTIAEEKHADEMLSSISESQVLADADISKNEEMVARKHRVPTMKNEKTRSESSKALAIAGILFVSSQLSPVFGYAETRADAAKNERQAEAYPPGNTGRNARDVNDSRITADDQKLAGRDVEILALIRKEIVDNKNLSTGAKNIKIVVKDGVITLRGPVKSVDEKTLIAQTSSRIAPKCTVVNQLEVSPG